MVLRKERFLEGAQNAETRPFAEYDSFRVHPNNAKQGAGNNALKLILAGFLGIGLQSALYCQQWAWDKHVLWKSLQLRLHPLRVHVLAQGK